MTKLTLPFLIDLVKATLVIDETGDADFLVFLDEEKDNLGDLEDSYGLFERYLIWANGPTMVPKA